LLFGSQDFTVKPGAFGASIGTKPRPSMTFGSFLFGLPEDRFQGFRHLFVLALSPYITAELLSSGTLVQSTRWFNVYALCPEAW